MQMHGRKTLYKLILVGDATTGKTSTYTRFVDNKFSPSYRRSLGADYLIKNIQVENTTVMLQCWDTAGEERFVGLGTAFYRNADAFLIFYDLTNPQTLQHIPYWLDEIEQKANYVKDCVVVLVG